MPAPGFGNLFQGKEALLTNGKPGLFRWPIQVDDAKPYHWRFGPPKLLHTGTRYWIDCDTKGSVIGQPARTGAYLVRPGKSILFAGPHADTRGIAISPDGKYAATTSHSGDEGVKVWDTETGQLLVRFPVGGGTAAAFSPDGKWLVVGGYRGCRMVKVGTWEERPFDSCGVFCPDGTLLAAGASPGVIRLLETATGREIARLADPNQDVPGSLTFTPDGGKLLDSSNFGSALHLWDLRAIRTQLAELGLDWDMPPLPPVPPPSPKPLQIQIDLGDYQKMADAAALVRQAAQHIRANKHAVGLAELRKAVGELLRFALAHNNLAWELLTGPKELRMGEGPAAGGGSPGRRPGRLPATYHNTLGVALYRVGQFAEAVPVLERSRRKAKGQVDAFDLFFWPCAIIASATRSRPRTTAQRASGWFTEHKSQLTVPGWVEELTAFQAECDVVLAEPSSEAKK